MIDFPETKEQARTVRYRQWGGNERGDAWVEGRCAMSVADGGRSVLNHQCRKKATSGPGGLYCGQHAPWATTVLNNRQKRHQ